ncbi:MAG: hypothetical protein SGJ21_16330 [Alphaproteobacteria bacterium]|nr:hypothetical protein [Alphaproteobacteria bacterium]
MPCNHFSAVNLAALVVSSGLAACTPGSREAVTLDQELAGDLTLLGTEPFWALEISDTTRSTIFTRPDFAPVTGGPPERVAEDDGARFVAGSPDGDLEIVLTKRECAEGMSDRTNPYEARLEFGGETFRGCAGKPAA